MVRFNTNTIVLALAAVLMNAGITNADTFMLCLAGEGANKAPGQCKEAKDAITTLMEECASTSAGGSESFSIEEHYEYEADPSNLRGRRLPQSYCGDPGVNPTPGQLMALCIICPSHTYCANNGTGEGRRRELTSKSAVAIANDVAKAQKDLATSLVEINDKCTTGFKELAVKDFQKTGSKTGCYGDPETARCMGFMAIA